VTQADVKTERRFAFELGIPDFEAQVADMGTKVVQLLQRRCPVGAGQGSDQRGLRTEFDVEPG
jgi:hypothetical protein